MIEDDAFGCAVTASDPAAVRAWSRTIHGFLAHASDTPAHLSETLRLDPAFALAQACRGLFSLLLCRRELIPQAREALALARNSAAARDITRREAHYIDALHDWLDDRPRAAAERLEAALHAWPHDPLAMKLVQAIRFLLGDQQAMRRSIEDVLPAYEDTHPARGYLHGCYAFTLEEAGEYARAEEHGLQALDLAPDDAWGLHAVAHVYDMTGRPSEGLRFLTARRQGWAHCNNFRYHVLWHQALMQLDLGETDAVLALYDTEIRHDRTDDYRDIANASSLLMRLELEGVEVGSRWEELAALCANRIGDGCLAFADLHYLLALGGVSREGEADALIARIRSDSLQAHGDVAAVMRRPGLALARGLKAFRDGAYGQAYAHLVAVRPLLQRIGGSHAQRDVFERITIEAAIRSGGLEAARTLLDDRTVRRGAIDGYSGRRCRAIEAARVAVTAHADGAAS